MPYFRLPALGWGNGWATGNVLRFNTIGAQFPVWVVRTVQQLGFEVLPSGANFVFARHPARDGAELAAALRARAIIVRHFKQARIDQFLRITIGTPEQNQALLDALQGL